MKSRGIGHWLPVACALLVLGACGRNEASAAKAGSAAVASAGEVGGADGSAAPGCSPLQASTFSSLQGTFGVEECAPAADARTKLHFTHRGAAGGAGADYWIEQETLETVTSDQLLDGTKFWDGHILTLDLPQERGGLLVIANWTGKGFVFSEYPYLTGDEDSMKLSWQEDGFIVDTEPEGKRRLLAGNEPAAGTFAQEAWACSRGARGQSTQSLKLPVDLGGGIAGLSYTGTTPSPDGTAYVCTIDVRRGDDQAAWSQDGDSLLITFERDDTDPPDGPDDPDRLRITRKGDSFVVDFDLFPPRFCGQSAQMPRQITLRKGGTACVAVD